jgi:hypothetical protein
MWTARQILGNFIRRRLTTPAAADERATANSILSSSFSAYRRDQWRISSNYNVVKLLIGTGYKPSVEAVRTFVAHFPFDKFGRAPPKEGEPQMVCFSLAVSVVTSVFDSDRNGRR